MSNMSNRARTRTRRPGPSSSSSHLGSTTSLVWSSKMAKAGGDTPNTPPCAFWLNGYCRRADDCRFRHDSPFSIHLPLRDARADQPCKFFIGGRCKKGPACPYKHQLPVVDLDIPELVLLPRPEGPVPASAPAMTPEFPRAAENRAQSLHKPTDLLQRVIRNSISVTYGPGMEVVKVGLSSDSVLVELSGLLPNVRKKGLMMLLRQHGDPVSLEMHRHGQSSPTATATYTTQAAAARAALELNGLRLDTTIISAAAPAAGAASLRTNAVKLVWDEPTHNAVLHYRSSEFAHRRALAIHGLTFDGRRLAAFYQDEGQPSVVIPNLPFSADPEGLRRLGCANSIHFAVPSYKMEAARAGLQALLERYGRLDSFYVLPRQPGDNKVRAVACFRRVEHLEAAMGRLHGTRQPCVAGSHVWFHRAYSLKYAIPAAHFAVIRQRIMDLRADPRTSTSLRVIDPAAGSHKNVILQIQTEDPARLAHLKGALEDIMTGQVLRSWDGRILWDSVFAPSDLCRLFLQGLNDEGNVFITCDTKKRCIAICGSPNDIADAGQRILRRFEVYRDAHTVIGPRHFTEGGAGALQATLEKDGVHLENGAVCPVCHSEAFQPVHLSCGHDYCIECLQSYLVSCSSSEARIFPIRCIGPWSLPMPPGLMIRRPPTCDAPIPVAVICKLLLPDQEATLLDASFTAHVYANPCVYRFCPTPDCDQVYCVAPPGSPTVFTCPRCIASRCTACHRAHPGLTCERHSSSLVAHMRRPDAIKRCPSSCGALLQKQDGCNHVQCPICKVHMCWLCLQMFANGGVYEHIASVHGEGFMPGVLPDNLLLL